MYSLISGFINYYFEKDKYKVLIVGEESVGKTVKDAINIIMYYLFYYFRPF